jgi:hypothetical protein
MSFIFLVLFLGTYVISTPLSAYVPFMADGNIHTAHGPSSVLNTPFP